MRQRITSGHLTFAMDGKNPMGTMAGGLCEARCRAMPVHGRAAWGYIPNPPRRSPLGSGGGCWCGGFFLTLGGGTTTLKGSSAWRGRNPAASHSPWAPSSPTQIHVIALCFGRPNVAGVCSRLFPAQKKKQSFCTLP